MPDIMDMEQGSPQWFQARLGIPTASEFRSILAKGEGKMRRTYMLKLIGERLTGEPADSYSNQHMERGKVMEAEARDFYAMQSDADIEPVGFIRNGEKGCSPDALIGVDGMLEIKTKLPHLQIEAALSGELPNEHKAQVQGGIWVAEREWCDFVSYWPKLPMLKVRVHRDDDYIATLEKTVDAFLDELHTLEDFLRRQAA